MGKIGMEKAGTDSVAGWYILLRTDGTSGVKYCRDTKEIKKAIGCGNISSVPVRMYVASPFGRQQIRLLVDDEGLMMAKPENYLATEVYAEVRDRIYGDAAVGMLNFSGRDICGFGSAEEAERVEKNIRALYH